MWEQQQSPVEESKTGFGEVGAVGDGSEVTEKKLYVKDVLRIRM